MNKAALAAFKAKGVTQHFLKANSPSILAGVGVTGTLLTAYLTGKASFQAARTIDNAERKQAKVLEPKDKVDLVWKFYIPAAVSGGVTVSAIIVGTAVGTRRTAALAAAYSLSTNAFTEYRDKVREEIGERKEHLLNAQTAQDELVRNPPSGNIIVSSGQVMCYERFTGRYFESSMEALRRAENKINAKLNREMYAYLSDFYDLVGLDDTSASQNLGWTSDRLLELEITSSIAPDGTPCLCIEYNYAGPV